MGGLFSHEYVTGPFNGTGITVTVALANTSATDTVAGITTQPGQNPGDGVTVPALTILTFTLDLSGGKAPIQGWVSILTQTDRVVPTVTITSDEGSQTYLPGDLLVFDLVSGARLW